ncbi:MAG: DUF192 domain-containing protein [Acidimicrobiales bacterium]
MREEGSTGPADDPARPGPLLAPRPWLSVDGTAVAAVEVATSRRTRARGLLGRTGVDGALVLAPASSVHTFAMAFPIDVAFCRRTDRPGAFLVDAVRTLPPSRMTRPRIRARMVIEAEAGAFSRWGLVRGSRVEIVELGRQRLSARG